ncbi:aminodeoxychorismate lyase [Acidithiobacillus sp.]|uniref:aminodeoxychorismate lyase n=1 Tax=Acidithiobacillus sp. TaxID=1872118 RepID=UPI0025BD8C42|nr:aminodeoxychorismate lyase [Acidithiobacillus sp.]
MTSPEALQSGCAASRAAAYGDGLFETIAVVDGRPLFWRRHLRRMAQGSAILGLEFPERGFWATAWRRLRQALAAQHWPRRCVLKLSLARREGRGYWTPARSTGHASLSLWEWPQRPAQLWREGIVVGPCPVPLQTGAPYLTVKSLNRLNQIMARRACPAEWDEAWLCDARGGLREGILANLLWRRADTVFTPELRDGGIPGVQRDVVMSSLQRRGWSLQYTQVGAEALADADEIFFCNSLIGVWAVRDCAGRKLPGAQGALARQLLSWHRDLGLGATWAE